MMENKRGSTRSSSLALGKAVGQSYGRLQNYVDYYYYYYYYYYPTMWAFTASSHWTSFTKALCPSSKKSLTLKKNLRNFNINSIIFQCLTLELDIQTFKTIFPEFISHLPATKLSEFHLHVLFNPLFTRNVRFRPPVSLSPILSLCVYSPI